MIMRATDTVDMQRLLKATLRLRPDRIIVGEVRGGEALAMLKAWNTGHPGGVCTVHANHARAGLTRIEQMIAEVSQTPMHPLIAEAVNLIVSIVRTDTAPGRRDPRSGGRQWLRGWGLPLCQRGGTRMRPYGDVLGRSWLPWLVLGVIVLAVIHPETAQCVHGWRWAALGRAADHAQERPHRAGRLHHLLAGHGRLRRGAGVRRRDQ